jgi:5'-nucleotidase
MRPRYLSLLSAILLAGLSTVVAVAQRVAPPSQVTVQLLAINDFHGNLDPPSGTSGRVNGVPVGGVEFLSTHLARAVAAHRNSIVVAAGDLIGAAPLLSSLFHDEPTIEAMNALHLSVTSVGNHEFDHGPDELLRMERGGCASDGCQGGHPFKGASFDYLSANVVRDDTHATLLKPTAVRQIGGVRVGFIGETMRDTPGIVSAAGTKGLTFLDEAATANQYAAELVREGIRTIVLLIHQGGRQDDSGGAVDPNGCAGLTGAILPIVERLSPEISVVISAHTHRAYNCRVGGHLVTNAGAFGQMVTQIELQIDRHTGEVVSATATNRPVTHDVAKDPAETAILQNYRPRAEQVGGKPAGSVTADIPRRQNAAGESALGDVIADAFVAAARDVVGRGDIAFMNQGGIRADIVRGPRGTVTYRDLFAVQPFDNVLTVVTMTGEMIKQLLEEQFDRDETGARDILQVSGLGYRYRTDAPRRQHVDAGSITLNGRPLQSADRIRVAAPDFVIDGGGGFRTFGQGTERVSVVSDLEAVIGYFRSHSPVSPRSLNRIVRID